MGKIAIFFLLALLALAGTVIFFQIQNKQDKIIKEGIWINQLRTRFGGQDQPSRYLYLVPKKVRFGLQQRPFMLLPVGACRFNELPLFAFFQSDGEQQDGGGNQPAGDNQPTETYPDNGENQGNNDTDSSNNDDDDAPDDWPETEEEIDEMIEDEINEKLDQALLKAFENDNDSDTDDSDNDPDRIRLRYGIPPPWYPFDDAPSPLEFDTTPLDEPRLDPDFSYPRWDDLKIPDDGPPPGWPGGEWPPRQFGLPDELKPRDDGLNLGSWRLYLSPPLEPCD